MQISQPQLLTDGTVALRPPSTAEDAEVVAALLRLSLPELQPWLPWAVDAFGEEDARDLLHRDRDRQGDPTYNFLILAAGVIVGACSMHLRSEVYGEVGYWIATPHARRGLATASTRLLVRLGFETLGLSTIFIRTDPDNIASQRVASKVGAIANPTPILPSDSHTHPDGTSHELLEFILEFGI